MNYVAPRKMTVSSTSGRSVSFEKGEPTFAPPQMHADLIAVGIVPTEELPEPKNDEVREPIEPKEREAALFALFEKLILRGKREEFTGVGLPHLAVMKRELGWEVAAKERDATWAKFQQEKATT